MAATDLHTTLSDLVASWRRSAVADRTRLISGVDLDPGEALELPAVIGMAHTYADQVQALLDHTTTTHQEDQ